MKTSHNTGLPRGTIRAYGPFTWVLRALEHDCEVWDRQLSKDELEVKVLSHFCIKNYGGVPGSSSFSGWTLVSGGPFNDAGQYSTFDEALHGITPWLVTYYKEQVNSAMRDATRLAGIIKRIDERMAAL